jgi:hypothetical protein
VRNGRDALVPLLAQRAEQAQVKSRALGPVEPAPEPAPADLGHFALLGILSVRDDVVVGEVGISDVGAGFGHFALQHGLKRLQGGRHGRVAALKW